MSDTRVIVQQVGVSAEEVRRIVNARVAPVERDVAQLEAEMANVEGAVKHMHGDVASRLGGVRDVIVQLNALTQTQLGAANAQLLIGNSHLTDLRTENVAGFEQVRRGLEIVDDDLRKAMSGVVQMEIIRLLAESQAPLERLAAFGDEIQQRFAKAVESVCSVRAQYDQLTGQALDEYEHKLREIGEHIYRIYDEEFQVYAEKPLQRPPEAPVALPLAADQAQVEARTSALEAAALRLRSDVLAPLQQTLREFERVLRHEVACELPGDEAELALPVAYVVRAHDDQCAVQFIVTAEAPPGADGLRLVCAPLGATLARQLEPHAERVLRQAPRCVLGPTEREAVKRHLRDFAQRGLLDAALLPGYDDLLDEGELEVPRDFAPSRDASPRRADPRNTLGAEA